MMLSVYNKLSSDELDDVESQYENIEVLYQKMLEVLMERQHFPALELHIGEIVELQHRQTVGLFRQMPFMTQEQMEDAFKHLMWDYIKGAVLFGVEIGRAGWPLNPRTCREVHE
jgi:hypothetical protein